MITEESRIMKELILYEERLLENRSDAATLKELLDAKCVEFAIPGTAEGESDIDSNTVRMIELSDDCKLLLYIAAMVCKNARMKSNQSSIWKKTDSKWKLLFHQETKCTE